jgi:asparagine synthase (glutamine-hydrolysing)
VRWDGKPAEHADLAPVLTALATRGPDGSRLAIDGAAILGHSLLATTPEALVETLPLRHTPTGCVITADVRLDNRDELLAQLDLAIAGRVIGDGELILHAYLRWGADCPVHLLGDFAFLIWDPRHQRVFAARDKVGMKQLIYHLDQGRLFACASDATALMHHPEVPHRINEARIADAIEGFEAIDLTSTFFCDVFRLPPAHSLLIEQGAMRIWRYWQLTPTSIIHRANDAAYAEALMDVLRQAVKARMRSPSPVGSMLSGGLDSGSVSVIAAQLLREAGAAPLKTFSAIDADPDCLESRAIRAALGIEHIDPQLVSIADAAEYREEITRLNRCGSEPFDGHMPMIRAIYRAAKSDGIKVMLDGVAGDTTLPTGDVIAHLIRQGKPLAAWQEARAQERYWDGLIKAKLQFRVAARNALLPRWLNELHYARWREAEDRKADLESMVHPDLAARVDLPARRRMMNRSVRVERDCRPETQALRMLHPHIIVARERYDRVASDAGIEPRDPFLDTRVLEFCLTLPIEQIHKDGWSKLILRRMLAGKLPDSVIWKTNRHHVGWRFVDLCTTPITEFDAVTQNQLFEFIHQKGSEDGGHGFAGTQQGSSDATLAYLAAWIDQWRKLSDDTEVVT